MIFLHFLPNRYFLRYLKISFFFNELLESHGILILRFLKIVKNLLIVKNFLMIIFLHIDLLLDNKVYFSFKIEKIGN